jgi:transposase InsO family protein
MDRAVLRRPRENGEYSASDFQAACGRLSITQSAGRVGSALDNAVVEAWHSTLEFELLSRRHFATRAEARRAVAIFIDTYNTTRRHSSCQMLPPATYEAVLAQRLRENASQADAA